MLNNNTQPQHNSILDSIKKKIHKFKTDQDKLQHNIKICPFPPGIQQIAVPLTTLHLQIPLLHLSKQPYHKETLLWDLQDKQSDEQLFRNLFAIVFDLLHQNYQDVHTLTAAQASQIIDCCIAQIKLHQKYALYNYYKDILPFDSYIMNGADTMINITINLPMIKEIIQWDLENEFEFIDQFAYQYCYENRLNQENQINIGNQIRDQIIQYYEKKLKKITKLDEYNDIKYKFSSYVEYPSFEHYSKTQETPKNQELNTFFKKNIDFLLPDLQVIYGNKPQTKQIIEMTVDYEDIKKLEKDLSFQDNQYMDEVLVQELVLKNQNNINKV